ncbi:heat shock 22 kDa protein, mitochondrial-like [Mercurialis annua]|uniref:heat shock 22 kDa protein, mitochondrial-like n=1 Tax=Mercurialis annua TaxID=3986 RepID=UPI00215DE405|nr:heat shock 22 kDa protein, mitochondrial-like [Mercurialis annua]
MASSLALKRLTSLSLVPASVRFIIRPTATFPSASRYFNATAARHVDDDENARDSNAYHITLSHRTDVDNLSLAQKMMDRLMTNRPCRGTRIRRGWELHETDDALNLRIEMPGLAKEDVNVSMEQNTLVIKGEEPKESGRDEESGKKYCGKFDLVPEKLYKGGEIKAEMKNGVLKVVVPKVKEEERGNVVHVKVE